MSDDWDFYSLLVDSEPASIFVDLGLANDAPIQGQPIMNYVRIFMRKPRSDGLSSNEEFDDLVSVERALEERLACDQTTYAGRNTSSGNRDFYYYTSDPLSFAKSAEAAMAAHPLYEFEIGDRPDPRWEVYFGFLYPSPTSLQQILNRRVVDLLADQGDDHSVQRTIDHVAYLPDAAAASALRGWLVDQKFDVNEPSISGGQVAINFERSDRPDDIDDVVAPLVRKIAELGGDYDGWGCEVAK